MPVRSITRERGPFGPRLISSAACSQWSDHQTSRFIHTAFGSVKLSIAAVPCSRPRPDSPHGRRTDIAVGVRIKIRLPRKIVPWILSRILRGMRHPNYPTPLSARSRRYGCPKRTNHHISSAPDNGILDPPNFVIGNEVHRGNQHNIEHYCETYEKKYLGYSPVRRSKYPDHQWTHRSANPRQRRSPADSRRPGMGWICKNCH
jgi:hypothetical protein